MRAVWDDAATLSHALAFEAALAQAEAAEGLLDDLTAEAIVAACAALPIDPDALAEEAAHAGTLAIPLVRHLRGAAGEAGPAVHRGATSQDLADTVLSRQIRAAARLIQADLDRITAALAPLARETAGMPAMGRTLLQDALPIGFGLRVAQWHAGIAAAGRRLTREVDPGATLQFGGAAGTRAGLNGKGAAIAAHLAAALGLLPAAPWHARREGMAGIAAATGIAIGALGKMARDISLLAQNAIGEAREPAVAGRGGSSAMAHKRNPTGCQIALAAATRAPGLVATLLGASPAEAERGLGGWQAEGPVMADLFLLAAGAAHAMAAVAEGLEIDGEAIARNLSAGTVGADIGESEDLVARLLEAR